LLLSLVFLMTSSFSCALFAPTPPAPDTAPIAEVRVAPDTAPDPIVDAVHEHLLSYSQRTGLTQVEIGELARTIVTEARRCDLDPALVLAVIHVESRFDAFIVSSKDAMGLMQIVPPTGEELAAELGIRWEGPHTLFDPFINVRIGVAYLRQLRDRYGDMRTALAAYNWGPGRIDRRLRRGAALPTIYAQLVFDAYGDGETARRS
jgi:soluble lytic murein transglycosylase-like protein